MVGGQVVEEVERSQVVHGAAGMDLVAKNGDSRTGPGRNIVELVAVMWIALRHDAGKILDRNFLEVEMMDAALGHKNQLSAGVAEDRKILIGGWCMMGMPFVLNGVVMRRVVGSVQRNSFGDNVLT